MMRVMGASGGLYVNISTSTKSDISFVCTYIFIFEYFSRRNVENLKVERGEEVFSSFGVGLNIDLLIYSPPHLSYLLSAFERGSKSTI